MTSKETSNLGIKERLNGYLAEKCQSRAKATPLTGDASDRQYFRLLIENQPSQVLALYKGPVQYQFEYQEFSTIRITLVFLPLKTLAI